jgi:hypothetical protein
MSNVSNVHTVVPFVSGKSEALTGQRLIRVLYKPRGNKPAEYPSVCVSVPLLPQAIVSDARFHPYFMEYLETVQDKVVKGLYEARKGKLDRVSDAELDADAMLGYLVAESAGERISKESIAAWFAARVRDNLLVIYAEKLGYVPAGSDGNVELTDEQMDTLLRECGKVQAICELMAGKDVVLAEQQKKTIQRVFQICSENESEGFSAKLKSKFDSLCGKVSVSEVLGF